MKRIKLNTYNILLIILLTILGLIVVGGVKELLKPCEHKQIIYKRCTDYRIEWTYGNTKQWEFIYSFEMFDNDCIIKKPEVCFKCGAIIGYEKEIISGSYNIVKHKYCY